MSEPATNLIEAIEAILDYYKPLPVGQSDDPSKEQEAYQKEFPGRAKAETVIKFASERSSLHSSSVVYVSLGGGDGEEIEHAMIHGPFPRGVLLEYMKWAADRAEARAAHLKLSGKELVVLKGDAAQELDDCKRHLLRWRNHPSSPATGLLISAQAVLHELPDRADPRKFDFKKIFALFDGFETAIFHSREPTRPGMDSGWREPVELRLPGIKGIQLEAAAKLIQDKFNRRFSGEAAHEFGDRVFEVQGNWVHMPGLVAIEFLHKLLRFKSKTQLHHEMEECLVALDPYRLQEKLGRAVGDLRLTRIEPTVTGGFHSLYLSCGVDARNAETGRALPIPLAFSFISAFKSKHHEGAAFVPESDSPSPSAHPPAAIQNVGNTQRPAITSRQPMPRPVTETVSVKSILTEEPCCPSPVAPAQALDDRLKESNPSCPTAGGLVKRSVSSARLGGEAKYPIYKSLTAAQIRKIARAVTGDWIDYLTAHDKSETEQYKTVGVLQIQLEKTGTRIVISANNYDQNGEPLETVTAYMRAEQWPMLKCEYFYLNTQSQVEQRGKSSLTFHIAKDGSADRFTGTGVDLGTKHALNVEGRRMRQDNAQDEYKLLYSGSVQTRKKYLVQLWREHFGDA